MKTITSILNYILTQLRETAKNASYAGQSIRY
jgi:hypothetical protein